MKKKETTLGTKEGLRTWLEKSLHLTLTAWNQLPGELRERQYKAYQTGTNPPRS